MPIFGSGPKRTDGKTNFQINATPTYLTPTQVPNLAVWFDAADTSTLTTNISSLNIWYSKTNISSVMSNAFGLPGPIWRSTTQNGLPVVRFDGTNNSFMSSISMAYNATTFVTNNETTMLLAYNPTNNGCPFGVTNTSYGGDGIRLHPQSGQSWFFGNILNTPNNARLDYSYSVNTGFKVESYYGRQGTLGARINGSLLAQSTMGTGLSFPAGTNYHVQMGGLLAGSRLFTQDIGEALIYNRGLSDFELRGVEAYLAKKWGTQNALPYQHPGRPTGAPLMGYRLALLGQISTLVASNAALWLDTYDANFLSSNAFITAPGSANPVNNAFVGGVIDKASQCNATSAALRQPIYNLVGLNNYPTLTYVQQPVNNRMPGTAPPYLGSSMSIFCVFNVASNSGTGYVASVSDQQGAPTNLGIGIYYNSNNRTIGINRANTVFSTSYTLQSNLLLSAFINGTPSTIGGLVPSTMSMNINGAQTNMSSLGSLLSSFSTPYYTMGGVYNTGNTNTSISEFIVYYRTLGTNERTALESQLIKKWGLVSNAPVSYINALPVTSGLFGWYDAYDQTTVLRNGSNNVSMWLDKSGQSNHMSTNLLTFGSNTGSNIYYSSIGVSTNSFSGLFFPSTFAFMQTSSLITNQSFSTFTMMAVTGGTKIPVVNNRTVSFFSTLNAVEGGGATIGVPNNQVVNTNITVNQNLSNYSTFHINTLLANIGPTTDTGIASGNAVTYFNGSNSNLGTGLIYNGMLTPIYVRLMGSAFSDQANGDTRADAGYLSEVLMYNRILNTTELTNVHSYLLNKWNISTLVSNVPVTRGLNLWLDAYDPDTVIFSTNTNLVRQWRDKSISTLHFSNTLTSAFVRPPTYTTNPANSLGGLLFSNSGSTYATGIYNCNFNYPVTKEATIFTVAQWSSGNASYYSPVFCMLSNNEFINTTGNSFTVVGPGNGTTVGLYRSTPGLLGSIGNTLDKPTLLSGVFNSSFSTTLIVDIPQNNMAIGRNGVIGATQISSFISTLGNGALSTTNFNVNQAVLGLRAPSGGDATWFHSGYIHEVLLYNRTLTFNERQQVESYLLSKWRI